MSTALESALAKVEAHEEMLAARISEALGRPMDRGLRGLLGMAIGNAMRKGFTLAEVARAAEIIGNSLGAMTDGSLLTKEESQAFDAALGIESKQ